MKVLTASAPLRSQPPSQFLQIGDIHGKDQFLSMDVMDVENMVLVEDDLAALMQSVQPRFVKWVVHDRFEEFSVTVSDPSPEIFAPTP